MTQTEKAEAQAEADNQWIEAIALRWGQFNDSDRTGQGTWPIPPSPNRLETIDSHVTFLFDKLRELRGH